MIQREHRMFFTTELCGALAIAFIRHVLIGTQLPTDCTDATVIHARLKEAYIKELTRCQIARRPWIWGAGDKPEAGTRVAANDLQLAVNITRDQRIDLINEKGFAMGDDEVRFHLLQLVDHQPNASRPVQERKFTPIEPLVFNCWDSIGHIIAGQWCTKNPQIFAQGQNVVTAVAVDNHWLPLWMVPDAHTLQVHTFHSDVDFTPVEAIIATLAEKLGFRSHVIHRIPHGLPEHVMCGAQALTFIAHVIVHMSLPEDLQELRTVHTNMRASFVAHLYSIEYTPKPVVWGNGTPRESGQLPIMPDENQADLEQRRQDRCAMLVSHSYAMGNDEIEFHLRHLIECHAQGPRTVGPVRKFAMIPPLALESWKEGDLTPMQDWLSAHWIHNPRDTQVIAIMLVDQHWVPFWLSPQGDSAHCHTLGDFARDDQVVTQVLGELAHFLGFTDVMIHRVPHGLDVSRLCGAMSISFLAHITLNTQLPRDVHQLRSRCWNMKELFAEAIQTSDADPPTYWGWGVSGESRLLPRMPEDDDAFGSVSTGLVGRGVYMPGTLCGMNHHEMKFHLQKLATLLPCSFALGIALNCLHQVHALICSFWASGCQVAGFVALYDMHWIPIVCYKVGHTVWIWIEEGPVASFLRGIFSTWTFFSLPVIDRICCGAHTWSVLAWICGVHTSVHSGIRTLLHRLYVGEGSPKADALPARWGFGPQGQLAKSLVQELSKHGIPDDVVEERASAAIRSLGSEQVAAALAHRQPWKQLKILGTNSRFQFVLPSELATAVETNKGKAIGTKGKGKGKQFPQPSELDPAKLQVIEGTFHCAGKPLPQLTMKQIGPVSGGFILISLHDAEPYLRAGTIVSREPLALLILQKAGTDIQTVLPHTPVTVPCRCTVNSEPVLADVLVVQLGTGLVEKTSGNAMVTVDTPEVATLKIMVYKDELKGDWDDFCSAPIRCLVSLLPKLKRCFTANCQCQAWHNTENLPLRDPILDVWRRQFLRTGFKPCPRPKRKSSQYASGSLCASWKLCLLPAAPQVPTVNQGQPMAKKSWETIQLCGLKNIHHRRCNTSCKPIQQ